MLVLPYGMNVQMKTAVTITVRDRQHKRNVVMLLSELQLMSIGSKGSSQAIGRCCSKCRICRNIK